MPEELPLFEAATRRNDHATSVDASEAVKPITAKIALAVLRFAWAAGPDGFIDDDLKAAWPDSPESSYRKRRTELAAQGYLVTNKDERPNRNKRNELIWHITAKGLRALAATDNAA